MAVSRARENSIFFINEFFSMKLRKTL